MTADKPDVIERIEGLAKALYETMSRQYGDRYADVYPSSEWDELGPGAAEAWREDARSIAARLRDSPAKVSATEPQPGPFIAYFTTHGEGWIVTDRERPAQTRIATVDTWPDDYGRANTMLIADALNRSAAISATGDEGPDL